MCTENLISDTKTVQHSINNSFTHMVNITIVHERVGIGTHIETRKCEENGGFVQIENNCHTKKFQIPFWKNLAIIYIP